MRSNMTRLAVASLLVAAAAACGDLSVEPKSQITAANIFNDPTSYREFLAKLYGGLVLTGTVAPSGNNTGDIAGIDEGFSQYVRDYWQMQELPTDEAILAWGDPGVPELNAQTWSSSNPWVNAMYSRIYYQIALANEFLRQTTPAKLSSRGVSAALQDTVAGYRAEARFLRALSYWHALDLYRNVPHVDENTTVSTLPTQQTPAETFAFIESELKAIRPVLSAKSAGNYYGRASQAAVDMVLAHLYLNAGVYTGTPRWSDARAAAAAVIGAGFTLDARYQHLFDADNNTSPELIFTVPQDGARTQTWGGMTYLVHAPVGGSVNAGAWGINGGWYGLRMRSPAADRFAAEPAGDARAAIIYTTGQTKVATAMGDFSKGYLYPKFRNVYSNGSAGSSPDFPDTDFPMFRLADAYLIYAEAVLRGNGSAADTATALGYVNALRQRAYGNTNGNITQAQLTLPFILDERSRELMWEGFRRQDLVRFGQFTTGTSWEFKGGLPAGAPTDAHLDIYPIPSNELAANPNVKQNPGY
jgi:hypothetical protein